MRAGAVPNRLKIVKIKEIPITYIFSNAIRIRAKVVREIALVN
jgi:hypothetical protein